MKITDFLREKAINVELTAKDKEGVIREMVHLLVAAGEIKPADEERIVPVLLARESGGLAGVYAVQVREGKGSVEAVLTKAAAGLKVRKTAALSSGRRVLFTHRLTNTSGRPMKFLFGTELTLNLKDAHVNRLGEAPGVRRFAVLDPAARLRVSLVFGRPARLWYFPLEAGAGARRVYQGVKLAGVWPVSLPARGSWQLRWELNVEEPDGWPRG